MTVVPRSRSDSHSSISVAASSAEETSSASSTSVSQASARARATRCTCPPESRTPRCPTSESTPPASATSRSRRAAATAGSTRRSAWSRRMLSRKVPDSTRGTWATWAMRPGRSSVSGSVSGRSFQRTSPRVVTRPASAESRLDLPEPTWPSSSTSSPRSTRRSMPWAPTVPSSCTAVRPRTSRVRSGSRAGAAGAGEAPATRSTPGGSAIRSPPPARRLVSCIQARVPGASVTTEPATRPNQSKPATALPTSSAVARPQPSAT